MPSLRTDRAAGMPHWMGVRVQKPAGSPARIGPFLIEGVIARGGIGVVYRAQHEQTRAPAAVKTVPEARVSEATPANAGELRDGVSP